ncbi:HDIG domain-containing protein [Myxococcota bacterium]|nr:HDIG domain-containing protein [Myxococcota bacterium]MBU1380816.1 HDIG domain-containing protein [Myxococcota bacterium]MBU1498950.1 HDIG domain-containing protein [Myxococcota bacterium]
MDRNQLFELLKEYLKDTAMIMHSLQSEAVARAVAQAIGEDVNLWGGTALLHDIDYEMTKATPDRHGHESIRILEKVLPSESINAIFTHNYEHNGAPAPASVLDHGIRCCETVTGLIHAASLLRPDGYEGMEPKSIRKKMKDKAFARNVSRECILECSHLGLELSEFLKIAINAMSDLEKS